MLKLNTKNGLGIFKVLILAIAKTFLLTGLLLAYNLEEYYPLNQNDIWFYSLKVDDNGKETTGLEIIKVKGTEKIGKIETKKLISLRSDNQCVVIDSEGVKLYKYWGWFDGDYEIYEPVKMLFPNMEVGKSVKYLINSKIYDIRDIEDENIRESGALTITLDSVEDVEVPAGKFKDCLKFISVYECKQVNKPYSGKETLTTWLAPGIGRVKIHSVTTEYNLDTKKERGLVELFMLSLASVNGRDFPVGASRIIYRRDVPHKKPDESGADIP